MATGIIPENSPLGLDLEEVGQDGSKIVPLQSDFDKNLALMIKTKLRKYKKYKKKNFSKDWTKYFKMYIGDQWNGFRRPNYRHQEVNNMIFTVIQSQVPLQTDVRPTITFIPEEPSDTEFAQILNQVAESDWENNNWLQTVTEIIYDGYIFGTGLSIQGYDPDANFGLGSIFFKSFEPEYFYPSPFVSEINESKSKCIITEEPYCLDELKDEYPEFKDAFYADCKRDLVSERMSDETIQQNRTSTDRVEAELQEVEPVDDEFPRVNLVTYYSKPDDTEEIESDEIDESGESLKKYQIRKKYPYGLIVKMANGIILEKKPFDTKNNKFPFSKYVNYVNSRVFWGISEIKNLESPQRAFNRLVSYALDVLALTGNPIWIVDNTSGVDPEELTNEPGLAIEKNPGSEVRRQEGVNLQPYVIQLINLFETWFNNIAGSQDVSRGQTPGSVTAASAIEQLQEASRTRIRQKQRNLDGLLRDFSHQYYDFVVEHYSIPRLFRVTNNQNVQEYFKMNFDTNENGDRKAIVQKYGQDEKGQPVPMGNLREYLIKGRFDVKVNTGSSLPFTIADKENKAFGLYDRQIIDAEEVLKTINYPDREAVLKRMEERAAAAAQQQPQQK